MDPYADHGTPSCRPTRFRTEVTIRDAQLAEIAERCGISYSYGSPTKNPFYTAGGSGYESVEFPVTSNFTPEQAAAAKEAWRTRQLAYDIRAEADVIHDGHVEVRGDMKTWTGPCAVCGLVFTQERRAKRRGRWRRTCCPEHAKDLNREQTRERARLRRWAKESFEVDI